MQKVELNQSQRKIVQQLNDELYTVESVEKWLNTEVNVFVDSTLSLRVMGARGFYAAVKAIEKHRLWILDELLLNEQKPEVPNEQPTI